jgi:hypothetical protein
MPGMFVNYYAAPYKTSKHVQPFQNQIDFNNRRAIVLEGENSRISVITIQDFCNIVAKAVDYEGEWPTVGGIRGDELTIPQLITIGERVRSKCCSIPDIPLEISSLIANVQVLHLPSKSSK